MLLLGVERTFASGVWIPEEAGPHPANGVFDKDQFETRLPPTSSATVHQDGDGSWLSGLAPPTRELTSTSSPLNDLFMTISWHVGIRSTYYD